MPTGLDKQFDTIEKLEGAANAASRATGKRVCVVMEADYAAGGYTALQWVAPGCPFPQGGTIPQGYDKAAIIAEAQSRIAAEADPSVWALVVEP